MDIPLIQKQREGANAHLPDSPKYRGNKAFLYIWKLQKQPGVNFKCYFDLLW